MLRKKANGHANGSRMTRALTGLTGGAIDRRTFLRRSGLTVGGLAGASALTGGMIRKAEAQTAGGDVETVRSVCTHCSVGCTVEAEVQNGVWVGQEPGFDSPFSLPDHFFTGNLC